MKLERWWLKVHLPYTDWGKRYGAFGEWKMTAGKVEILLVVSGLEVDRSAEA